MNRNKFVCILLSLAVATVSLPSTFDIRYQPSIAMYGNFETSPDHICESYDWSKQLTQIFSNKISVDLKQKVVLSAQHLAECVSSENDKCKEATLQNIEDAFKYIQNEGIVEEECYKNKLFEMPSKFCGRNCTNGQPFVRKFKAMINQETDVERLLEAIGNGEAFGFAVFKYYESMNYYSPDHPENLKNGGEVFSYGIGEIIGWRKGGEEINLRMGASGWGYKGYAFVAKRSPIIVNFYSIKLLGYQQSSELSQW